MSSRVAQKEAARARRLEQEREAAARERRKQRLWLLGGVVAAAAVIVIVLVLVLSGGGAKGKGGGAGLLAGIPEQGITLGNPNAPVTLVEFGDLKCPSCRAYSQTAFPALVKRYVRSGKVRMVFRVQHFVGQPPSDTLAAARMAEAAGLQNKLWPFAEAFYANQQDELTHYVTDGYLRKIAGKVPGLDVGRALAQRDSPAVRAELDRSAALFARYANAGQFTGTPSFLVGRSGQQLKPMGATLNFTDPGAFASQIDPLLK